MSRLTQMERIFVDVDADLWFLTETHEQVAPCAEFHSAMSSFSEGESGEGARWVGIWSRYPLTSLASSVSDTERCTAALMEHPQLGNIIVFGLVLPWGGSTWRGIESKGGAAFAAALDDYFSDIRGLQQMYPGASLIVAGDFNQDLAPYHYYGSKEQRERLEYALCDAGLLATTRDANDPLDWDPLIRHACIDHICISRSVAEKGHKTMRWPEFGVPDRHISDHFCVAVELLIGEPT